jgi:hypothetical protein
MTAAATDVQIHAMADSEGYVQSHSKTPLKIGSARRLKMG